MNEMSTNEPTALSALLADPKQLSEYPIETVERLYQIHKEEKAEHARIAFHKAFNLVQGKTTPVIKRGHNPHLRSMFARAEDVLNMLSPLLVENGFSYSISEGPSEKGEGYTKYVLTLRHDEGHAETHYMEAPLDWNEGNKAKTRIQGQASTYTFAMRHLLIKVFGVQLTEDNDGASISNTDPITKDQAMDLAKKILDVGADKEKFLAYFKISKISELPAAKLKAANQMLERKKVAA